MLDAGQPVIIDFGIAHIPDSTRLTKTGLVMGTPGYLAPEVIEGSPSSGASDVHSWGATVAYAATGRQPFGSGTYQTIFFRVLEGKPDVAGIPPQLLPFVTAALSTDPRSRPSARWLAGQLGMPRGTRAAVPEVAATRADYPPVDPRRWPRRLSRWLPRRAGSRTGRQRRRRGTWPTCCRPSRPRSRRHGGRRKPRPRLPAGAPRQPDWQPPGLGLLSLAAGVAAVALSVLLPVAGTAALARGDHPAAGGRPGAIRPRRAAQPARRTAERHRDRDRDRPVDRRPRGAHDGLPCAARDHCRAARRGGVGRLHPGRGRCRAPAAGRRAPRSRSTASAPGRPRRAGSCAG